MIAQATDPSTATDLFAIKPEFYLLLGGLLLTILVIIFVTILWRSVSREHRMQIAREERGNIDE